MAVKKKICMLGAFAVGKTSLVQKFVHSLFSEKYLSTVGVKIDKKDIVLNDTEVSLVIWDIQGEDELQSLRMSYLRGMTGYLLIVDGTRAETIAIADKLVKKIQAETEPVPFICCINKNDLRDQWEVQNAQIEELTENGWEIQFTSAKTGEGVEEVFQKLTERIL